MAGIIPLIVLLTSLAMPLAGAVDETLSPVTLEWDPNPEADLLGYFVYRSERSGGPYQRLSPTPVSESFFADSTAESGKAYYYVCTAVSTAGLESGYSNEIEVLVSAGLEAVDDQLTLLEDGAADIDVLANDRGDGLQILDFTQPQRGVVVAIVDGLRYSPPLNFSGIERLSYRVHDSTGQVATADVEVIVLPVNDPPVARPDQIVTERNAEVSIDVLGNDSDPDGDLLRIVSVSAGTGSAVVEGTRIRYSPAADFAGIDLVTYTISDGSAADQATVRVKVDFQNRPPEPRDDWSWTLADRPVAIGLLFNDTDPDGDLLEIASFSQPDGGRVVQINQSTIRFVPEVGFVGPAVFDYRVSDGQIEVSAQATVQVRDVPADELYFPVQLHPAVGSGQSPGVGIALLNGATSELEVELRFFGPEGGAVVAPDSLEPLASSAQRAFLPDGVGAAAAVAEADAPGLKGLFTFTDSDIHRMDGVASRPRSARRLYFHQLRSVPSADTAFYLFNPHLAPSEVSLQVHSIDGDPLASVQKMLPPLGSSRLLLSEIVGPFALLGEGYARLEGTLSVEGFATRFDSQRFTAEAAVQPTHAEVLIAPHFFLSRPGADGSRLRILNPGGATVHLEIEAFDDSGNRLAGSVRNLAAGGLLAEELQDLLELSPVDGEQVSGYLRIRVGSFLGGLPSLVGSIEFSGFEGTAATTLPLVEIGPESTVFPHLAQADEIFTGIALVNPMDERVNVQLEAFSPEGELSASRHIGLEPGQRLVEVLNSERLFGADFVQLGGHLRINATGPIVGLAILGSAGGQFLAAVEAQRYSSSSR